MAGNGSILSYWSAAPQRKDANASGPSGGTPTRRSTDTAQPSEPKAISPFSPPPKAGATATFHISPMPLHIAPPRGSSTLSRGSKTSPESLPSSPDSFPPSPIQSHILAKSRKENMLGSSQKPPASLATHEIRDSDDDLDSASDGSGNSAESLQDAVRFNEPFRGLSTSVSSTSLPAVRTGTGRATATVAGARTTSAASRAASSSSPNDSSSAPSMTKRRAATAILTSPLPSRRTKQARVLPARANPPKHKFDMMALVRHAQQEDATDAATRRVEDLLAETERRAKQERELGENRRTVSGDGKLPRAPLLDGLFDSAAGSASGTPGGSVSGDGGGDNGAFGSFNRDRLRKALDRTEVAAVSESWYFFKEYFVPSPAKRRPFPQKVASPGSRWAFLRDATMRQDFFMMGVVRKAVLSANNGASGGGDLSASQQTAREPHLPDELFLWILNEACVDPLPALRAEYAAVLRCCPEQVRRFVDAERLLLLFQKLGPRWESIDLSTRLELVPTIHRPYPGRDWSPLRSLLSLVAALADCLTLETVSCAVKILLRLGIDRVVEETPDLLQDYQEAMRRLVGRVPLADWNDFCHDTGSSLYNSVQKPSLRWQVLACMPLDTPACHDMRRRLASVLFFNDPERARQDPRRQIQLTQGLAKLAVRDDLVLTPATNFVDLTALVDMLSVFLDDVGREALLQQAAVLSSSAKPKDEVAAAAVRAFDADIDSLVRRLKVIGHGIESTGGGHIAQLDSKTAFERLQIRLTHSVRTRPRGRKSIFDGPGSAKAIGGGADADDDARGIQQKQQDIRNFFMQRLGKKMAKP
ncbi:hypothetical protein HMPREF1624_03677 [Sporothrix schenckii ATCC 58251]|uniref:Uncharacterized protein n=1 Tax=Sporothrix schenckii (strain ATCC 58251 / de Perez 2211183) TaxID=1391915 RepID=U7Q0P9_SPOS1|nr:hypothetical protein HMPREF1624_03677 [Sporothrix schenckii ATCC 58251]